jgi:hypothetical protein
MSVSVTLRQATAIIEAVGYRVISRILTASPDGMYPLFVFQPGIDPWGEVYLRVADLDDLNNYVEVPLNFFYDTTPGKFSTAVPTDKIVITSSVPDWISPILPVAEFVITEVGPGGDFVIVDSAQPFPFVKSGLAWTLTNSGGTPKTTGTAGYTTYEGYVSGGDPFLRRDVTSILGSVEKASSRATAIKTGVDSIVTAAHTHGIAFEGIETVTYEATEA